MQHRHNCFIILLFLTLLLSTGCANQQNIQGITSKPTVTIPGVNGLDGNEEQAILSYHNEVRASVNVPPLHWSIKLSKHAATWAATLASQGCTLKHSQDSEYGENLFIGTFSDEHDAVIEAASAWEDEKDDYSGQALNKDNWSAAGHYTQMVWRDTTELGCAKVACGDKLIVVCNYNPAGNRLGAKPY